MTNIEKLGYKRGSTGPETQLHLILDELQHNTWPCNFSVEDAPVSLLPQVPARVHEDGGNLSFFPSLDNEQSF